MKINKIITIPALLLLILSVAGCNKFLDKEPYRVAPEMFFENEAQLEMFTITLYNKVLVTADNWNLGPRALADNFTDNQTSDDGNNLWVPGERKVLYGSYHNSVYSRSSDWSWNNIYNVNYFLDIVVPRNEAGGISGSDANINQYIGEAYFFRAYEYYAKLRALGDVPIVTTPLPVENEILVEASVRQPRDKVAKFIIEDLNKAISLLSATPVGGTARVNKKAAQLLKSNVALFEGSWEKNFKGTAFVPNGEGWTGAASHPGYVYNAEESINYFLDTAIEAADAVASTTPLTVSPENYDFTDGSVLGNPYYEMFGTPYTGLVSVPEVLLHRAYDPTLGPTHYMCVYLRSGGKTGYTNQFVKNFLMKDGLPSYASSSEYPNMGDAELKDVKANRDNRLQLFMQGADEEVLNVAGTTSQVVPHIILYAEERATTGYTLKKRATLVETDWFSGQHTTADVILRASEAYLNYIEAYYLRHGSIGGNADKYWRQIRERANIDPDYNKTIAATNMAEEAKVDLAAYTAGEILTDVTLYNIRRERRCEFIAEGFREYDLKRYRALDQLISDRVFLPQGFNLWDYYSTVKDPHTYDIENDKTRLVVSGNDGANVSKNENFTVNGNEIMEGKYLYPLRIRTDNNLYFDGYKWTAAHYLNPIGSRYIAGAIKDGKSVVYQNPGWGTNSGDAPVAVPGFN